MNEGKGKLFVISGPSGVGKGTALKIAMENRTDLSFSVSATTREPRPGEIPDVSYTYITVEQFRQMIDRQEFLEYDEHNETYYGTPLAQLNEKRARGPVLLDIDPMGAKRVKAAVPDAVLIFIMPPSVQELERRLRGRGDTSEEQIVIRLGRSVWEMEQSSWYDYVVVNNDPEQCAKEILDIVSKG